MRERLILATLLSFSVPAFGGIPSNPVMNAGKSLDAILSENNPSTLKDCMAADLKNTTPCLSLLELLKKKMNTLVLESDLQIQAEKIQQKPIPKLALDRIAMLSKINLLATQAEETVKSADINLHPRSAVSDSVSATRKVQTAIQSYEKLFVQKI